MNIFDGGLLTKGREGKDQDQKENNPSNPNVLTLVSHRGYFNPNTAMSNVKVQTPNQ
jgi:hypothetical protein